MKSLRELMLRKISKSDFLKLNDIAEGEAASAFLEQLQEAYHQKNDEEVDSILYLLFAFDAVDERFVHLLNDLLISDWHEQHENIAMLLQKLKSPNSILALYEVALKEFSYLSYDESCALAVKCIWALGDIGTDAALEKLKVLSHSSNRIIAHNASKQIERYLLQ